MHGKVGEEAVQPRVDGLCMRCAQPNMLGEGGDSAATKDTSFVSLQLGKVLRNPVGHVPLTLYRSSYM